MQQTTDEENDCGAVAGAGWVHRVADGGETTRICERGKKKKNFFRKRLGNPFVRSGGSSHFARVDDKKKKQK